MAGYNRQKLILYCDKIMEYSLYLMAFFLPISKAIIEITSSIAIVAFFVKKAVQEKMPSTYLNVPLCAFVIVSGLSLIGTDSLMTALRNYVSKLMQQVLLFFAVFESINTRQKIKNILFIMFASALLVSTAGITQYFTHKDFLRGRTMPFKKRINAPFYTPNDLGAYLVPIAVISLNASFVWFKNKALNFIMKILPLVLLAAIIMTFSRGAWLSLIFGLIFMFSISLLLRNKEAFLIVLLVILIMLLSLPLRRDIPLTKIFDLSDAGSVDRKGLWTIAWNMIKAKPLFGHGIGTFMHNFKKYNTVGYAHAVSYAHNCYLQIAAETGIFGLGAFLWVIFSAFILSLRKILNSERNVSGMLLGLICGLAAFLIHSSVETNLYSLDIGMLFWLMLGLSVSAHACLNSLDKLATS